MAKMVGLSRNIKIMWLNKTVELINEGLSTEDIKKQLNDYLSYEINSPTNLPSKALRLLILPFYLTT